MLANGTQSDGDTQPLSQSVYEFYSNRSKEKRAAKEIHHSIHACLDAKDGAPYNFTQGETGNIDLLAVFEQPSIEEAADPLIDDQEDDIDPLSQDVRADLFPESRRFQPPKTPASQGQKRKRATETSSQGQPTPKLPINPFAGQMGSIDGLLGASQLFQATQAQTSPMTNMIPSDGISERPSPEMHYHRPSTAGTLSSPARLPRSNALRAATEPQTTYTTMKESQEARERQKQAKKAEQAILSDELSDDDFAEDTQLRRRLRQQKYSEEAKVQFASVAARSESATRSEGRRRERHAVNTPSRSFPRRRGRQASEPVLISDDPPGGDGPGSITEDETEREESLERQEDDIDELAEENKENVEVPRTISRAHQTISQVVSSQPTPSHARQKRSVGSQKRNAALVTSISNPPKLRETRPHESATQPDAIEDSQSSQQHHRLKSSPQRQETRASSELQSSLDARVLVPQSQSSEPPRAPQPSNSISEEQSVRSSSQPVSSNRSLKKRSKGVVATHSPSAHVRAAKEGADTRSLTTTSPSGVRSHPKIVLEPQVRAARDSNSTLRPLDGTIADSEPRTENTHSAEGGVPDSSNMMLSPTTTPKKSTSNHSATVPSRNSTLFETAPENPKETPSKSLSRNSPQNIHNKQLSPTKARIPRTISEIAADPSPPDDFGEIDIDIDILSNEDKEFQKVVHGSSPVCPSRKRRRGARGTALQIAELGPNNLPPLPGTPVAPPSSAISAITPVPSSSPSHRRTPAMVKIATNHVTNGNALPSVSSENMPGQERVSAAKAASVTEQEVNQDSTRSSSKPRIMGTRRTEPSAPQAPHVGKETAVQHESIPSSGPDAVTAPNRVFAHFNGSNPAYYPATCLEIIGGEEPRYRVRFDDGTVDTISAYGIKRLELKIGDVVKVDIPGARTKSYIVVGMRDQQRPATPPDPDTPSRRGRIHSTNDSAFPETDAYGYATVLVDAKQRNSVDVDHTQITQIAVPLTQIYLTQTMWTAFRDRQYSHVSNALLAFTGLQTPSERPSTPSTPSSRTRRIKASTLTQSRSTAVGVRVGGGLFKNMAFAITNVDRTEDSKRVKDRILSNGGIILENGFDELFNIPCLNRITSPKKDLRDTFHIASEAQNLGFTCLIADKHCRRAKFIQALALGIPCLATRWISDCITKQRILPWASYLLASGESTFLGGAVRSRNLPPFSAETATLSNIVNSRPNLLENASVLLIMEKSQEGTMKQHPLITHALGASRVSRALNEDAAAKAVADAQALGEPWDWVFSYDKEKAVERRLWGASTTSKKRKRARESEIRQTPARTSRTKVVGNEFVIQSLIMGILIDD